MYNPWAKLKVNKLCYWLAGSHQEGFLLHSWKRSWEIKWFSVHFCPRFFQVHSIEEGSFFSAVELLNRDLYNWQMPSIMSGWRCILMINITLFFQFFVLIIESLRIKWIFGISLATLACNHSLRSHVVTKYIFLW